jgi:hypothetical protein
VFSLLPAAEDGAVGEVEPEVGGEVTPLALPATRRDPPTIVQLKQIIGKPKR